VLPPIAASDSQTAAGRLAALLLRATGSAMPGTAAERRA